MLFNHPLLEGPFFPLMVARGAAQGADPALPATTYAVVASFWARRLRAYADLVEGVASAARPADVIAAQMAFLARAQHDYAAPAGGLPGAALTQSGAALTPSGAALNSDGAVRYAAAEKGGAVAGESGERQARAGHAANEKSAA